MRPLLLSLVLTLCACSAVNREHCGNQSGDATCIERDPSRPFCSVCVADNDGCLEQAPASSCEATSAAPDTTSPAASTTDTPPTTSPSTGDPLTTSTGTGTDTDASTTSTTDTSTGSTTTAATTGTTDNDTTTGPFCGNDIQEGQEVCDGEDLAGKTCANLLPDKWGGGQLVCNECASFNDTACCIGVGQKCDPFAPEDLCCAKLACTSDDLPSLESHCQNR